MTVTFPLHWELDLFELKPLGFHFADKVAEKDFEFKCIEEKDLLDYYDCDCDDSNLSLETIAPGFTKGINFDSSSKNVTFNNSNPVQQSSTSQFSLSILHSLLESEDKEIKKYEPVPEPPHPDAIEQSLNSLNLSEPPSSSPGPDFPINAKLKLNTDKKMISYARSVDLNKLPDDFSQVVPQLAHEYPFELDYFQKQAIYHLERGESVFVAAHTSAGKTVVAEYAIALSQKHMTKTIYTSPIKALSNQKFRDFHGIFESVGLLTGDVQLNPDASCLIMTTEILRSMLYRGASLIQDVEFVVFDEVHYLNDQDRGVVWEEVIIMLPPHVTVIMLSATTPNNMEFADWVGRTRNREIFVISTLKRPVPLEHYLFTNRLESDRKKDLYKIVDAGRTFNEQSYRSALQSLQSLKDREKATSSDSNSKPALPGITHASSNFCPAFRNVSQERNLWTDVVYMLQKRDLLPAVAFTFSKRKCDENADNLSNLDLNNSSERSAVHVFLAGSLSKLHGSDAELPQIVWLQDLLTRGIGVHHSGLLPLMKEAVEILFSRGLIKILFATETFAMGVNMPARTVVFSSLRKHDGNGFRYLHPGEYTQMAGRAGRRGKDLTGTVILLTPDQQQMPNDSTLRQVILGTPTKLISQFRLTYQMILSLLRIESLRVEEMLKRSFSENFSQKNLPEQEAQLQNDQIVLDGLEQLNCSICSIDLQEYYAVCQEIKEKSQKIFKEFLANLHRFGSKFLTAGTVVIADISPQLVGVPAVILKQNPSNATVTVAVAVSNETQSRQPHELVYPPWKVNIINNINSNNCTLKTFTADSTNFIKITEGKIKLPSSNIILNAKDSIGILAELSSLNPKIFETEAKFPQFSSSAGGFEIDELVILRRQLLARLPSFTCHRCPELVLKHYTQMHKKRTLTDRLASLRFQLSDSSLSLLPEYENRIKLLEMMGYIDAAHTVQIKGRIACDINTVDPLILTELLFENAFGPLTASEAAALLAGLVFQERSALSSSTTHQSDCESIESLLQNLLIKSTDPSASKEQEQQGTGEKEGEDKKSYLINVTPNIYNTVLRLVQLTSKLSALQRDCGLGHLPCGTAQSYLKSSFNPALIRTVYEWTRGTSFLELTTTVTTIAEGSIVRCMTRLDEVCREVAGAGKIMGDPMLVAKMEEAAKLIRRDICFSSSLYL